MADSNNKVSLGCGTFILIALIVLIFGNTTRNMDKKLNNQIEDLSSEIATLKSNLAKQADTLTEIKQALDELKKQPRPRVIDSAPRPRVVPAPSERETSVPELLPESPVPEN